MHFTLLFYVFNPKEFLTKIAFSRFELSKPGVQFWPTHKNILFWQWAWWLSWKNML